MPKNVVQTKLTIPDWSELDRPREKFLQKGASALSDAELVAILLRSGTPAESAVDVAKRLLANCDNKLDSLAEMSVTQLMKTDGIGQVKALTLLAAFELGARKRAEKVVKKNKITSSQDLFELLYGKMSHLPYEEFWTVFVNQGATVLACEKIGQGGIDKTVVDIRLIMQKAIELSATGIFVCHNHPSGNVQPSRKDIDLTHQIREAASLFNIRLVDHLIIGKEDSYSFCEAGIL